MCLLRTFVTRGILASHFSSRHRTRFALSFAEGSRLRTSSKSTARPLRGCFFAHICKFAYVREKATTQGPCRRFRRSAKPGPLGERKCEASAVTRREVRSEDTTRNKSTKQTHTQQTKC